MYILMPIPVNYIQIHRNNGAYTPKLVVTSVCFSVNMSPFVFETIFVKMIILELTRKY